MAQLLETDTFANKDISAAVAIGTYTAAATRMLHILICVDQVAGGGDYVVYATLQRAGAGSHYRILPQTTGTAAAALTAIGFVSIGIPVKSTDVVTVYIDGLAGDTVTPDTFVDFFESDYLAATQGAVTFGQVKIAANVAGEGALDIENTNAAGYGLMTDGQVYGQYNLAGAAGGYGQYNVGDGIGLANVATGGASVGHYNSGVTYGLQATGGTDGAVFVGVAGDGLYTSGAIYGIQMVGGTAPTDPDFEDTLADIEGCTCGGGAIEFTYTVTDSGTGLPIEGVYVWVTTDVGGANIVWNGYTDAFGVARDNAGGLPWFDAGDYYFWSQKAGYTFVNPDVETVA